MEFKHKPVMLEECINGLNIKPEGIYVDGTLGGAGHSKEIAKRLLNNEIDILSGKVIYELDIASTVGGTKYRGEFEEKLKRIIKRVKEEVIEEPQDENK